MSYFDSKRAMRRGRLYDELNAYWREKGLKNRERQCLDLQDVVRRAIEELKFQRPHLAKQLLEEAIA